ncbi:MAG: flagellar hook-basal body complex protein FliE [bacterium]|nr:flagellar hook-basal body complex protein FliE [bacterium]
MEGIDLFSLMPRPQVTTKSSIEEKRSEPGFYEMMLSGIEKTNELQNKADILSQELATGQTKSLHEAMIAFREAEVSLNFVMAIRNNLLRSYQEILSMGR